MRFLSWLDGLKPDTSRRRSKRGQPRSPRRKPGCKLSLEILEDRCQPSFLAPVSYPAGLVSNDARAVVTADFNRDGRLDLAVANFYSNSVSVLLGNADGTFQPARNFDTGSVPLSLAVGDFNGDGKLDIVTANALDVSVLLGNGDGTFQPPSNIYLGVPLSSVAVGDFNGDSKPDLVVLVNAGGDTYTPSDGYAVVMLGNGDGSFSPPSTTGLGSGYRGSVVVADFNRDGKLDIATENYDHGTVSVLLGDGLGNLLPPTDFSVGPYLPGLVVAGDVNGDGNIDLVTANSSNLNYNAANTVSVLLGDGMGSFGSPRIYATGNSPGPIVLGDVNRDGQVDLILTTATDTNRNLSVLFGIGGGAFSAPRNFDGGYYPGAVVAGDFNGDGWLDVATVNSYAMEVSVLINDTSWSATPAPASSFVVSGFPSPTTAGTAGTFTVTAETAGGTTASGYTGTIHFASSDAQAGLPADYTFIVADAGVHTFSATLTTAGTQAVTATDTTTASVTGSETGIIVNPRAASMFLVAGFPSSTTAGVSHNFTITARDPYGNIAISYSGTVHLTSSDGKASLPANYTFTATDAGVHTFSATLKTAGTQSITATDSTTASLTGTDGGITVNPAAASKFIITAPASVTAGVPFSLTVKVEDAYGNVVTNYAGTIHFSSTDSTATLRKNYTFTSADKGVHTFTGLVLRKRGTQKITLTDTLNSALNGSVIENVL